ncbi:MAG: SDR family oxidoreductase [Planctomycetes bacterium]|nr:SDR family oxidoreductase [Planctomycetota bacterium]
MAKRKPAEPTVQQLFDLTGRVVLITGAAGHLGSAMSRAFAEAGATLVIASREADKAAKFAASLPRRGRARHHGIALDHMSTDSCEAGFMEAVKRAGRVDVLVNNALHRDSVAHDLTTVSAEEFSKHQENNTGYFILSRIFRNHIVARNQKARTPVSGSVIMIGSMYGVVGSYPEAYKGVSVASPVQYHALKGGTVHMTRHLAVYWAKDNVRVNCLSPGPFPTDAIHPEMKRRLCTKSPMGRMGHNWELKGAALFFASDASGYVTGQNLLVDGGWTAW